MISLYIDTSSNYLYTGLVQDDQLLVEAQVCLNQNLSIDALPIIVQNFEKVQLQPSDIDRIVVVNGPGSFTGVRIGITIAKVMAWSLQKPIVPVSSLEAMALSVSNCDYRLPLIDARRGYVYGAIYDKNMKSIVEKQYTPLAKLLELAKEVGSFTIISNDFFDGLSVVPYYPDILKIVQHVESCDSVDPHLVNPDYLKKTEAEEKYNL